MKPERVFFLIKFTAKKLGTGDILKSSRCCFFRPNLPLPHTRLLHLLKHSHTHKHSLFHHKGRHARAPPLSYVRKNATLQTIPTVARGQYLESIFSMIALIWAIQRVSIYMRKSKLVKTTRDSWYGCVCQWQKKKRKQGRRNNVADKHTSKHNASVCRPDTTAVFHSSSKHNTHTHTLYIYKQINSPGSILPHWGCLLHFIVTFSFLHCQIFQQPKLMVIT